MSEKVEITDFSMNYFSLKEKTAIELAEILD